MVDLIPVCSGPVTNVIVMATNTRAFSDQKASYPTSALKQGRVEMARFDLTDFHEEIVALACEAWNKLVDQPWKIMSIGRRDWANAC